MGETMRAVDIKNGKGPATSLFLNASIPKPVRIPGTALVRIKAFGLNRMDLLQRDGNYPIPPGAPSTLGVEFSGTIEEIDEEKDGGKENFKKGDEVFGLAYGGAYAEFIVVSTKMLLRKPKGLKWEEAAGIPEAWITATQSMFFIGEFTKGKSILWHAGASSVSIAGIQLSKVSGASKIFITAGSDEKIKFCTEELGADFGVNYKTQDWSKEILKETDGKGVDIVIDFVGAPYFQGNLDVAARHGRIVQVGGLGGMKLPAGVDIGGFIRRMIRIEGSSLRGRDLDYQEKLRNKLETYLPKFEDGTLKLFVDKVFKWEDVVEAHKFMESNASMGKLICTID